MIHDLKCWPEFFKEIWNGDKTFELRLNDRNFQPGDKVVLNEFEPMTQEYSGNWISYRIGNIVDAEHSCAMSYDAPDKHFCILSIKDRILYSSSGYAEQLLDRKPSLGHKQVRKTTSKAGRS